MPGDMLDDGGNALDRHRLDAVHFPRHCGNVRGILAVDIFVEHRLDFGAALLPLLRRRHLGPIVHGQHVREFGIGIGLGLFVIGIARLADVIGRCGRLHCGDAEQLELPIALRGAGLCAPTPTVRAREAPEARSTLTNLDRVQDIVIPSCVCRQPKRRADRTVSVPRNPGYFAVYLHLRNIHLRDAKKRQTGD